MLINYAKTVPHATKMSFFIQFDSFTIGVDITDTLIMASSAPGGCHNETADTFEHDPTFEPTVNNKNKLKL